MKIWLVVFCLWIVACVGTYVWLNPQLIKEEVIVEPMAPVAPPVLELVE